MQLRRLLQTVVDGEADPADRERVARHLEACRRCGLEVATYRLIKAELAELAPAVDVDALERLDRFVAELASESPDLEG